MEISYGVASMGTGKKEAVRKEKQGKVGDGLNNVKTKGENFYRYVEIVHVSIIQIQCG